MKLKLAYASSLHDFLSIMFIRLTFHCDNKILDCLSFVTKSNAHILASLFMSNMVQSHPIPKKKNNRCTQSNEDKNVQDTEIHLSSKKILQSIWLEKKKVFIVLWYFRNILFFFKLSTSKDERFFENVFHITSAGFKPTQAVKLLEWQVCKCQSGQLLNKLKHEKEKNLCSTFS